MSITKRWCTANGAYWFLFVHLNHGSEYAHMKSMMVPLLLLIACFSESHGKRQ